MRVVRSRRTPWLGVGGLVLGALLSTGFTFARTVSADASLRPSAVGSASISRAELRESLLALTNADRTARGRDALDLSGRISRAATRHSRDMAERGAIFHSSDEELRAALDGLDRGVAGENVGVGGSLEAIQRAFVASPDHSRNVLARSYDDVGIGVVVAYDRVWVTVVFAGD